MSYLTHTDCKYCKKPIAFRPPTKNYYGFSKTDLYCPWCNRKIKTAPSGKIYEMVFKGRCSE